MKALDRVEKDCMGPAKSNIKQLNALGKTVARQRKALGLTQKALAELANVGPNFVGQIEAGKSTAHISKVLDVLKALGLQLTIEIGKAGIEIKNV